MNVLFFGTPSIAVPYLEWLSAHHNVVGVVCQPDKPVGRGYEIQAPPVKKFAQQKGLPVFQPQGRWEESTFNQLRKTSADVGIAVAYGRIMPKAAFLAPRLGTLNIHFSLLPKYRGAAPMQWALIKGEKETGVTAFWLEKEMDSGPIFHAESIKIDASDDAASLEKKLVPLGVGVLGKVFADLEQNKIVKAPQQGEPTLAPLLEKEHGNIDWSKSSESIANLIRGIREWPVAWTTVGTVGAAKKIKILKATYEAERDGTGQPGQILQAVKDKGIIVLTGSGCIFIHEVQPEGKKPMSAWAFWQGAHLKIGERFV